MLAYQQRRRTAGFVAALAARRRKHEWRSEGFLLAKSDPTATMLRFPETGASLLSDPRSELGKQVRKKFSNSPISFAQPTNA